MTNAVEIPSLCDQLAGIWPNSVQHAYWLGVFRARAHEYGTRARLAANEPREYDAYLRLRDSYIANAERALEDLKAAIAQETAP